MAKFSKGDKVESVKTGAKGVVDEVYGDEKYAVLFDGSTNPDRVDGFQIKAANGCAKNAVAKDIDGNMLKVGDRVMYERSRGTWDTDIIKRIDDNGSVYLSKTMLFGRDASSSLVKNGCARNAKFKVGDKVTDGNAVYEITDVDDGIYEWKFVSGKADPSHSEGGEIAWAEGKMRLANSRAVCSTNAVVQNAINARRARNAIDFNGESAKVRKALEGRLEKLVQKFKNDLNAVVADVGREYKKYQSIEPDSASLIKEVEYWIDSLKDAISQTW